MPFQYFSGPAWQFPPMEAWVSFDQIFNANVPEMLRTGNTTEDVARIRNAVFECAHIGVDERVIFCIIMQESTGYVGVRTTWNMDGRPTGGLMQCDGCPGFEGRTGLSQEEITSMIRIGTLHYKGNLRQFGDGYNAETIYKALRVYNSGSCNENDLSDGRGATPAYISDMANRLCGRTPH